jgi:hypothetical protein
MPDPTQQPQQFQGMVPGPQGGPSMIPSYNGASPGMGGAIMDAVRALAMALGPKAITQQKGRMNQQEVAQGSQSQSGLGNQF